MDKKVNILARNSSFLYAILLLYLTIGGIVFRLLEHGSRAGFIIQATEEIEENRAELLKALWAETIAKSENDWSMIANERMDLYEKSLRNHVLQGINLQEEEQNNPWTLMGSIFYCFTVITTIGYGNIAPTTVAGKILTIPYGLVGIPLSLGIIHKLRDTCSQVSGTEGLESVNSRQT